MKEIFLALAFSLFTTANGAENDTAWSWYSTCGQDGLEIDVTLSGRVLYHSRVPICNAPRTDEMSAHERKMIKVAFAPTKPLKFSGYRPKPDVVPAGRQLELDIWEAGGETGALILGVSVLGGKLIYMNTLLIAKTDENSSREVGADLVVTTKPVKLK